MATNNWNVAWTTVRDLGAGGHGAVRLVERKSIEAKRQEVLQSVMQAMNRISMAQNDYRNMVDAIRKFVFIEPPQSDLGALKEMHFADDEQARERFAVEIDTLTKLAGEPGILKFLDGDAAGGWFVTEYHDGGSLESHPTTYRGRGLEALRAFRPIVAAVAKLHKKSVIHRDIN